MLRKQLSSPDQFAHMPSYLGHIFRLSYQNNDPIEFYRKIFYETNAEEKMKIFSACREQFGMYGVPDKDNKDRQQYIQWKN
jgi:hypothetical protein